MKPSSRQGSEIPKRNGWAIAEQVGDRTPDRTRRLLNRTVWDAAAVVSRVRQLAIDLPQ